MSYVYARVGFGCFLMLARQRNSDLAQRRKGWSQPHDPRRNRIQP
jgi:hypothetical protein